VSSVDAVCRCARMQEVLVLSVLSTVVLKLLSAPPLIDPFRIRDAGSAAHVLRSVLPEP